MAEALSLRMAVVVAVGVPPSCSLNKKEEEEGVGKGGNLLRTRSSVFLVLLCLYMHKRSFYQDRLGTNKHSDNHSTKRAPMPIYLCRSGRGKGRGEGRRRQFRVVSTTLVQDEVGTDSAPNAVLHAGDTGDSPPQLLT